MRHASGLCRARRIASSSSGLYLTMRPTSRPQLADRIAFGLASSMRVASSFAAKPPNTTECTAPMRAQARGKHLRLHLQAMIGDAALLPRQRGIVDDRRLLAAPAQDVAIDRVPAGVADAAGEPAPVDAGIGIEHLLGRF